MADTSAGKIFEGEWKDSFKNLPYTLERLIDGVKWGRGEGSSFTPGNVCDYILHTSPVMWYLELKSTKGTSLSFFPNTPWIRPKGTKSNKPIKPKDVDNLMKRSKNQDVLCGFIFNFRARNLKTKSEPNRCYWVHIDDFVKYAVESGSGSISAEKCSEIGIEIQNSIKRTKYKYHVQEFIRKVTKDIIKNYKTKII